jgi:hypothetical protein
MTGQNVGPILGALLIAALIPGRAQGQQGVVGHRHTEAHVSGLHEIGCLGNVSVTPIRAVEITAGAARETKAIYIATVPIVIAIAAELESNQGLSNAPLCAAQLPSLLNGYNIRPDWRVAGVDYCVGFSTSTVLKDPATISMAGVSVNTSSKIVTITGNNVTLDGYDFSLNGGWEVSVQAANTTIANSNFAIGSNNLAPIISTAAASNMTVTHSTIDGNGQSPGWGGLISYRGNGFTVEYSWLKNAGGDMIQQVDGGAGSTVVVQNNLIQNGGLASGAHGDYTQLAGGPFNVNIAYNTTVQNGGATQGLMTEYTSQGQISHNTMIGSVSYFISVDLRSLTGTFAVQDNYYDLSHAYGFVYPNSGPDDSNPLSVFVHNVNMRTGTILQDADAPAKVPSRSRSLR